jgi:hypothetical protein
MPRSGQFLCEFCWLAERVTRRDASGRPITLTPTQAAPLKRLIDSRTREENA